MQEHDEIVAQGRRPHRVTEFFAGSQEGTLRPDMEAHAAGNGMSERLASEIRAYQLCKVDDTWAEAAHRDVSGFGARCKASSVAYVCASQRFNQTLARTDEMTPQELRQFYHCMRRRKAIGQLNVAWARALKPLRKPRKFVNAFVYRYDKAMMFDWESVMGQAMAFMPNEPSQRKGGGCSSSD